MNLSKHFTLEEMTFSATGTRRNIKNVPSPSDIANMKILCETVLEPIRSHFRKLSNTTTIRVLSGYRGIELNKAVGGSLTSQHMKGEACDFVVTNRTIDEVFDWIVNSDIDFDQVIHEFNRWIHISYTTRRKNRRRITYAVKGKNGKTIYRHV